MTHTFSRLVVVNKQRLQRHIIKTSLTLCLEFSLDNNSNQIIIFETVLFLSSHLDEPPVAPFLQTFIV